MKVILCRAPWASWAQRLSVSPHYRKQPSLSLHDLPWFPMGRFKQLFFFFFFFLFIYLFILFFNFTILYWFCHISTWIHHRYTRGPHPEPSSLFPPHTIPLGKGRDTRPRRNNQERPWGKVLFPHQCIHTITLSYFAETESPSRWEQLMINDGMLPKSL